MTLLPNQIAELERRGVENVRVMVQMTVKAPRSTVGLDTAGGNPAREDVEEWLRQTEAGVARRRRRRAAGWTVAAAIATGIAAGVAVLETLHWW
ncbi:MAG TPA: hypothetical protein VJR47_18210 [Stellaceae bacterium]|nr:hypothetical protein [Stellaceae bacterium]